jgi:hypothetical protein
MRRREPIILRYDLYAAAPQAAGRFMKYVSKREDGCWDWLGHTDGRTTRGQFFIYRIKTKAHLAAYRIFKGDRPRGKQAHHTCLNQSCVNPDHLVFLTQKEHYAEHKRLREEATACGVQSQ